MRVAGTHRDSRADTDHGRACTHSRLLLQPGRWYHTGAGSQRHRSSRRTCIDGKAAVLQHAHVGSGRVREGYMLKLDAALGTPSVQTDPRLIGRSEACLPGCIQDLPAIGGHREPDGQPGAR